MTTWYRTEEAPTQSEKVASVNNLRRDRVLIDTSASSRHGKGALEILPIEFRVEYHSGRSGDFMDRARLHWATHQTANDAFNTLIFFPHCLAIFRSADLNKLVRRRNCTPFEDRSSTLLRCLHKPRANDMGEAWLSAWLSASQKMFSS